MFENLSKSPFLSILLKSKILLAVDYFFASKFYKNEDENILLSLCYIFAASRHGHLCVKILDKKIYPDPRFLFFEKEDFLSSFMEKLFLGFSNFPKDLFEEDALFENAVKPLFFFNNSYYLHKNYLFESSISDHFLKLSRAAPLIKFPKDQVDAELSKIDGDLNIKQKEAIEKGVENSISFIFGGPGTGKTYTAAILVTLFSNLVKANFKIILAAPTGKAALNLESKIKGEKASRSSLTINSFTLHSLLKVNSIKGKDCSIDADLLIIDEASMIDAKIFSLLLGRIKIGARVLFIGDPDQLPPIESGNLFSVFAKLNLENKSTVLDQSIRNDTLLMKKLSEAIRRKEGNRTLELIKEGDKNISYKEINDNFYEITQEILEKVDRYYLPLSFDRKAPEVLLKNFSDFKILTALKVGALGVDHLNNLIFDHIRLSLKDDGFFTYPIMITKNDYDLDLYNGTLGVVIRKRIKNKIEEIAYFLSYSGGESVRQVPLFRLSSYDKAYALTVHKSQGSEFEDVLLVFPKTSSVFGKELLYTAVTRTRRGLNILGSDKTIKDLVANSFEIQTNLQKKLSSLC